MKGDAAPLHRMRHDDEIRAILSQQADRIGMKAGNQIQFNLRPMLPEGIHRRHQPVKAGMALHGDSQQPGLTLRDASEIAFSLPHSARDLVCQVDEKLTCRRQPQRVTLPFEKLNRVALLNGSYLVRDGRLGKI
ncbi:MAG: hypothetical protein WCA06_02040 [Terrimicrobiaceae bacterium]